MLPEAIREKLSRLPEYGLGTHKVAVRLRDGRMVEDVIVAWEKEIISVGGEEDISFSPDEVVDVLDRS
jgi:hypothetical protein